MQASPQSHTMIKTQEPIYIWNTEKAVTKTCPIQCLYAYFFFCTQGHQPPEKIEL